MRGNGEATWTRCFGLLSGEFPSRSCADAFLFHGEVVEVAGRFPVFFLVFGKDRKMGEVQTRCAQELRVLWIVMREGQSIVALRPDEERSG